jgi:HAD superfamily hydrolase (TIGR01490 family)
MTPAQPLLTPSPAAAIGAFFDVDNTLVPGVAIEVRFFAYLLKHRVIGSREILASLGTLARNMPQVSVHPLRERKPYLAGKQPEVIEPMAEWFIRSRVCRRLSPEGLAALTRHRQAGHHVVLVTGSPDFLIAPLAAFLGVKDVLAARPQRRNGCYTGELIPPLPYGEGKRRLLERFAADREVDLAQSYGYGDSPGDLEALRLVGYPLVVNPIRGMGRIARRQGWPMVRWTLKR